MKIVIRAGGVGTRLWPLSRYLAPKQFQTLVGDKTMIRTTYERVAPLLAGPDDLFVSVNAHLAERLRKEIPELSEKNIISETESRNTGPAMCLETNFLAEFVAPGEIVASLPSDDFIMNQEAFIDLLSASEEFLKQHPDYILTPAVTPTYADVGYTYFKAGKLLSEPGQETIYAVAGVAEKPNEDYCRQLIKSGVYYCHTGMYIWQLGFAQKQFKQFQPAMQDICQRVVELMKVDSHDPEIKNLYSQCEKMTIETAITDRAERVAMSVSNEVGWSDLGKWHIMRHVLPTDEQGNLFSGQVHARATGDNVVYNLNQQKIIVLNDVKALTVIDTPDVLFISSTANSVEAKKIVEQLKEEGLEKYL